MLQPGITVRLSASPARFDFLAVDAARRRLLAAHTGNGSLDIVDLDQATLIQSVATGAAHDCAVDLKDNLYLVSVSKPPQLVSVDATQLVVTGSVPLDGPADLLAFNAHTRHAYVCHDDGSDLWVVDPIAGKNLETVTLPSAGPEDLAMDVSDGWLFQAMKTAGTIAVFNVKTNKLAANYPTAPAQSPHGIALIPEIDAMAVAGGNGKLVIMSQFDGAVLSSGDIPAQVDQIAYDHGLHRLYCASGLGEIAVFAIQNKQLKPLGEVSTTPGARSIAVDPQTHNVWIAYAKDNESDVQEFELQR
ncbi:MAG: hypothetical protein ABSE62_01205 [Chthoniobacteraceae bacterium]